MFGIDSLGIPLHPLVVHFPIVLSVLLPISVLVALWAIRKGTTPRLTWAVPVAVAAALAVSAFAATQTGEREEDRVEQVVGDDAMHSHEEAAERFLMLSGVLVLVSLTGLLPRNSGTAGRLVTLGAAVGLLAAGVQVGHSGGELVYKHGAASVYTGNGDDGVESAVVRSGEVGSAVVRSGDARSAVVRSGDARSAVASTSDEAAPTTPHAAHIPND